MTTPDQTAYDAAVRAVEDALCGIQWPAVRRGVGIAVPVAEIARRAVEAATPIIAEQARAEGAAAERERIARDIWAYREQRHQINPDEDTAVQRALLQAIRRADEPTLIQLRNEAAIARTKPEVAS